MIRLAERFWRRVGMVKFIPWDVKFGPTVTVPMDKDGKILYTRYN